MPKAAEVALLLAAFVAAPLAAQEPRPPVVTGLRFEGNKVLDELVLAAAISTSASSWNYTWLGSGLTRHLPVGTRRTLDQVEFRRDVVRLVLFYRQNGYYDARVDTAVVRRGTDVSITFRITEGQPVLIDSIAIRGTEHISDAAEFPRRLLIGSGRPFNRFLFEASTDTLVRLMRDRGYPFAQVFRGFEVDRAARRATVSFDVDPGPRARVGAIVLEGNQRISEQTVRRSLTFQPGHYFSQSALIESQRSLYQGDLFRYVNVAIAPDSLVDRQDSLVRVRVQLAEAEPLNMRAGVGYGTIDCFRVSGTVTRRNFLGGARQLDVTGRLSKLGVATGLESACPVLQDDPFSRQVNYLADVTVTQPSTLFKRTTMALSGFSERRSEYKAYQFESVGASVLLRFGFGRRVPPLSLRYRISYDVTDADEATYCIYFDTCDPATIDLLKEQPIRTGTLTVGWVDAVTDNPLEPTRGRIFSAEASTAAPWLGSQVRFDRLVAEAVKYVPLRQGRVLSLRVRAGILRAGEASFGDSSFRYVPQPDRFYAGGPSTVRGFGRNEMGPLVYVYDSVRVNSPTDSVLVGLRASPLGSNGLLLGNVELRVPTPLFANRVSVSAFLDAGELWRQTESGTYVPGGLQVTPGVGLGVSTPLGPMRLDVAYNRYGTQAGPLYRSDETTDTLTLIDPDFVGQPPGATFWSRLQWHFTVGLAF